MNKEQRDELILENMKLVYYIIKRYFPGYMGNEDVQQEGMVGLTTAANTWDESKTKFSTYASICILNRIRYYFSRENKHHQVLSLNSTIKLEDGTEVEYQDTLVGDEDVDLIDGQYRDFYNSLTHDEKYLIQLSMSLSRSEIASILGISERTVNFRKHKLKQKWRKMYGSN